MKGIVKGSAGLKRVCFAKILAVMNEVKGTEVVEVLNVVFVGVW